MANNEKITKKFTGKSKLNSTRFPKSINVNGKSIKNNSHIANEFNKYIASVEPNSVSSIQNTSKTFKDFLLPIEKNMEYKGFIFEVFERTFT